MNGNAIIPADLQLLKARTPGLAENLADIDASKLTVKLSSNLKTLPESGDLTFGKHMTDHMMCVEFNPTTGWSAPEIKPYARISLDPASSCFHYCTNIFEGMKAYPGPDGVPRLFRPKMNMARMKLSAARVALPAFDADELLELIKRLIIIDQRWVPKAEGCSLYIRPTLIGTRPSLGVTPSDHALLYVILSPSGPYFPKGAKPLSLLAYGENVRSWPGGTGGFKIGSNYTSSFQPQIEAAKKGYQQLLWLHNDGKTKPEDMTVTEAGAMNFFVIVKRDDGDLDAITPPLDGLILAGITRDSCVDIIASHSPTSPLGDLPPTQRLNFCERPYSIGEMYRWSAEGRLLEAFGVGTAVVVSSIGSIGFEGKPELQLPEYPGMMGPVARGLHERLTEIQEGKFPYKDWCVVCK